jgi:hypothetical protein
MYQYINLPSNMVWKYCWIKNHFISRMTGWSLSVNEIECMPRKDFGWGNADRGIIQLYPRMGPAQVHGYAVRTFCLLTPHNQLKRAVALTQKQVMHSGWLVRERVVESPR